MGYSVSSIYIWSKNLVAESEAKDGGKLIEGYSTSVSVPCVEIWICHSVILSRRGTETDVL